MGGPHKIVSGKSDVDPIFSLTLKKPKENQGFQLQPLKILRKIDDFHLIATLASLGSHWGPPGAPSVGLWGVFGGLQGDGLGLPGSTLLVELDSVGPL